MQLDYRILWFDDQPQAIRPFVERVSGIISRLGFVPNVDLRIITADVVEPLANLPTLGVDLVLMDWKLGGRHDGADLSRKVRQTFRDTDIIFYSSETKATLRELIFRQDIDGVYCCSREHLTDRANGIIQGQLRRILDLNHMRGIVMAATSDLDHGMIQCLEVVQAIAYGDGGNDFSMGVAAQVADSLRKKAGEVEGLGAKGKVAKLLREPAFGPALRLKILQDEVSKLADRLTEPHRIEQLGTYHRDVITPRNDFAHRKAELKDGKLVLEGRDQALDHESMRALRLRLLDHADNLRGLLSLLTEIASAAGKPELAGEIAAVEAVVAHAAEAAGGIESPTSIPSKSVPR
jgi:DNA-binding NarL/FixJ family response regulator